MARVSDGRKVRFPQWENLEEEVYVEHPPGFVIPGSESKVCRLRKALYGLKQAPRVWYQLIDTFFASIGLERSPSDANIYVFNEGGLRWS